MPPVLSIVTSIIPGTRLGGVVPALPYHYYVSTTGNDSNDGRTPETAWLTMTRLQTFVNGTISTFGITLSGTTGTVTATRSSGSWADSDVGKTLAGNSTVTGTGRILSVAGAVATVAVDVAFSTTSITLGLARVAEMPDGVTTKVFVASGTYLNQNCQPNRTFYIGTNAAKLSVFFGPSVVWQRTVLDGLSAFEARGSNWVLEGIGTAGAKTRITGWASGDGNGVGAFSSTTVVVRNLIIDGCVDGLSAHNSSKIIAYDCEVSDCNKAAFAHVDTSSAEHYRCTFTGRASASQGIAVSSGTVVNEDCVFVPATAGQSCVFAAGSSTRCKFGDMTTRVGLNLSATARHTATECFIHSSIGSQTAAYFIRCYGRMSRKVQGRVTDLDSKMENCVFVDAHAGASYDRALYAELQTGDTWIGNPLTVQNCIFSAYTIAVGGGFTAATIAEWGATSFLLNNCLFGNGTNISGSVANTGTITTNPLLGPCNSTDIRDWCVADNSPCVGAGVTGANIGFTLADIS